MDINDIVGKNIKKIRESKKLTLDAAAQETGVSRSMLAQIEKGDVNPTISVLWKIANGYKTSFSSLLKPEADATMFIPCEEISPLIEDEGRFINYPVFLFEEKKLFETYRVVMKKGGSQTSLAHLQGTEEYVTCFEGSIEVVVDGKSFLLNCGDSIKFRADVEHSYKNIGEETATLSMVIYYMEN